MAFAEAQAMNRITDGAQSAHTPTNALSTYINNHFMTDCLIVAKEFKARTPTMVIQMPARRLTMRMERDNNRLFLAVDPFKEWLRERNMDYSTLMNRLVKEHIVIDPRRMTTLGAGTNLSMGRVPAIEIDTAHKLMRDETPVELVVDKPALKIVDAKK
jgi:hypothetical protein